MYQSAPQPAHALNLIAVQLDPDWTIKMGVHPFSPESLLELRKNHNDSHFFKKFKVDERSETESIISIPLNDNSDMLSKTVVERKVMDSLSIIKPLTLSILLQYFHDKGRIILSHAPLRVLSQKAATNLIPESADLPSWFQKRVAMEFDTRIIYINNEPQIVLSCDLHTKTSINWTCDQLMDIGYPVEGRYVAIEQAQDDSRLRARRKLIGRIIGIDGESFILSDFADGYETVPCNEVYLEASRDNIETLMRLLKKESAQQTLSSIDALSTRISQGPDRFKHISETLIHLQRANIELLPGIPLKFTGPLNQENHKLFPTCVFIQKPVLVFDPSGSRVDKWNQGGLDKHGPYDQRHFTPKRLRIAVVCQEKKLGQVDEFMHKFIEGLPNVNTGSPQKPRHPYQKGFFRRYMLEKPEIFFFQAATESAEDYGKACREAIISQTDSGQRFDLAVIQIDDAFHLLNGNDNPYYVTKAIFLKHQIPVQEITLERMLTLDNRLVYILNNLSLACYAKIGGVPWLLKCTPTIAHELVIGLGSHHYSESRLGHQERVVGITTVFTSDGNYLLDNRTAAVPYESYGDALLKTLKHSIETIRKEQNWRETDAVRLIFHCFKTLKNTEIEAVERLMQSLGQTQATFAFLTFSEDHPLLLFDTQSKGVGYGNQVKGIFAPARGVSLKLTDSQTLLVLTGANELKTSWQGLPKPILMKLHYKSTFVDMTYLARQSFDFSCHSWRMFNPAHLPITILYSDLIAKMVRNLQQVADWDPDAMLGQIGRTRWFL